MTLLAAEPKQFQLKDDGLIYFQVDATNPMPGEPVARIVKGGTYVTPGVELLSHDVLKDIDAAAAVEKIQTWTALHIIKVLEPLIKMTSEMEGVPEPVAAICTRVHDALGIVPRDELLDQIEKLDAEMRKTLRARHIRLGPVLAFVPDLNKPAGVRLRALLWSLFHDKPLPAPVPKDGAVSVVVDPAAADPVFYRAIGYPLYGNRVIRIDMLDRVMNSIYENVKDNQFQAKHQMAEWLGCSVPDLYVVLEAMGHKKLDVAPAQIETPVAAEPVVEAAVVDAVPDAAAPVAADVAVTEATADVAPDAAPTKPAPAPKPDLAMFKVWWPRKKNADRPARTKHHAPKVKEKAPPPPIEMLTEAEMAAIAARNAERAKKFETPRKGGDGDKRQSFEHKGPKQKPSRMDKNLRNITTAPAPKNDPSDSPFAILGTLKFKGE